MTPFTTTALATTFFAIPALGNLYATRPIANTIYESGKEASITWIDDGKASLLADMPKLQLDLYSPDDMVIKTFSKEVDATAKKLDVWLSPTLGGGGNSSGYYFRFHFDAVDVYTARFTITGLTGGGGGAPAALPRPNAAASPNPAATAVGALGLAMAGSKAIPASAPSSTPAVPTSKNLAPTLPPAIATTSASGASATLIAHTATEAKKNAAAGLFDFDAEALKFRIVFILWPALIGISLAL